MLSEKKIQKTPGTPVQAPQSVNFSDPVASILLANKVHEDVVPGLLQDPVVDPVVTLPYHFSGIHPKACGDPHAVSLYKDLCQEMFKLGRCTTAFSPDLSNANLLLEDLRSSRIGVSCSVPDSKILEKYKAFPPLNFGQHFITMLLGAAGSGKSLSLQLFINRHGFDNFTIVVPTKELRADWKKKLDVPSDVKNTVLTYESALVSSSKTIVVVDDFGKIPPGWLDLYAASRTHQTWFVLTGDPRQTTYHVENENALIHQLPSLVEQLQPYGNYYLNISHRCPLIVCRALNIAHCNKRVGSLKFSSNPNGNQDLLLVSSREKSEFWKREGRRASTFAASQGLTENSVTIVFDSNCSKMDDSSLYTALTRTRDVITYVRDFNLDEETQRKFEDHPYIKGLITASRDKKPVEDAPLEEIPREEVPRTHLPVEDAEQFISKYTDIMGDKDSRELFHSSEGFTNQDTSDDHLVRAIPAHRASDEALFKLTCEKRLKFNSTENKRKEFRITRGLGMVLFKNFLLAVGLPSEAQPFNKDLYDSCRSEVEKTYLSKSAEMLQQGRRRQDPDFGQFNILLFLKSQDVKKVEKFALPKLKQGQTIAAFYQETVLRTGTASRYLRRYILSLSRKNVYIHCERTEKDLDAHVREFCNFSSPFFCNDYSAYDQSQDATMLNFETLLMSHFSVPTPEIEFYLDTKFFSKTFLGHLGIMRLTGEGPTFDFNTYCNIAYHHTRYDVDPTTPQYYAGDDMVQQGVPVEKKNWPLIENKFTLVSKPLILQQGEFVGFNFSKHGIFRNPKKLYISMEHADRTKNLGNCLSSYARDAHALYSKGDTIYDMVDEEQGAYMQSVVRKIVRKGVNPSTLSRERNKITTLAQPQILERTSHSISDVLNPCFMIDNIDVICKNAEALSLLEKKKHKPKLRSEQLDHMF